MSPLIYSPGPSNPEKQDQTSPDLSRPMLLRFEAIHPYGLGCRRVLCRGFRSVLVFEGLLHFEFSRACATDGFDGFTGLGRLRLFEDTRARSRHLQLTTRVSSNH